MFLTSTSLVSRSLIRWMISEDEAKFILSTAVTGKVLHDVFLVFYRTEQGQLHF